jgi:hypothetical protein
MALKQLEAAILREARQVTGKKKLRQCDIMEWTTGSIDPRGDETIFNLPGIGVTIAVENDALGKGSTNISGS